MGCRHLKNEAIAYSCNLRVHWRVVGTSSGGLHTSTYFRAAMQQKIRCDKKPDEVLRGGRPSSKQLGLQVITTFACASMAA